MKMTVIKRLSLVIAMLSLSLLIGCAGMEFAPKKRVLFYPKELPAAERAVKQAKKAGRDRECPEEYMAAKRLKNKAYDTYLSCRTEKGKKMAREAAEKARNLCKTVMVNFDFDKSEIKEGEKANLKEVINYATNNPKIKIVIEGHTDYIGTEDYNQGLSDRRAMSVKEYLVKEGGISKARISTVGYSELRPIASNKTEEGRAKNRRAKIHY
jgi:outer membrane protein OmpA-like peptidoglycan-associated protein